MGRASLFLAVPPNLAVGFRYFWYFRYKKTLFIHLRDESTRDTTQIAIRPSLVCCNGQNPKDSSSLSPKWKDNVTLTTYTNRCLSEKVSLPLLHHRLFLMPRIIDAGNRFVKGKRWGSKGSVGSEVS